MIIVGESLSARYLLKCIISFNPPNKPIGVYRWENPESYTEASGRAWSDFIVPSSPCLISSPSKTVLYNTPSVIQPTFTPDSDRTFMAPRGSVMSRIFCQMSIRIKSIVPPTPINWHYNINGTFQDPSPPGLRIPILESRSHIIHAFGSYTVQDWNPTAELQAKSQDMEAT